MYNADSTKLMFFFFISGKNKYGWGPPSSIFTFYNKGIGKYYNFENIHWITLWIFNSNVNYWLSIISDYSTQQIKYKDRKIEKVEAEDYSVEDLVFEEKALLQERYKTYRILWNNW